MTTEIVEKEEEYISNDEGLLVEKSTIPPKERSKMGRTLDPRQLLAWEYYVKSWQMGRPNAKQAGLDAGYMPNTAQNLNNFKWFKDRKDKLFKHKMKSKAERNLMRILNMDYSKIKILPDGREITEVDVDKLRIQADVSKMILTTLGKDDGYSTKTEIGGKMESEIKINSISYADPVQIENTSIDEGVKQLEKVEEKIVENIIDDQTKN